MLDESLLHAAQILWRAEALDGRQPFAGGVHGEHEAGVDGLSVHEHGAGAARPHVADELRPRERRVEVVAQRTQKGRARLDADVAPLPVHVEHEFQSALDGACARVRGGGGLRVGLEQKVVGQRRAGPGDADALQESPAARVVFDGLLPASFVPLVCHHLLPRTRGN